ncbi:SpoIIE family protein phosphatase [Streptomyces sp. CA2R101]|uniref:SpoIIE family protein phosphatase n=1 Tax=Streptomyces sp. CA2R101 TaxID=3120152 RepID=UPI0030092377
MAETPSGTSLATVLIDPDGRVQRWSDGARALTGYPDQEVIGRDAALLADRTRLRGGALVDALLRSADSVHTDWLRCRDGTCRSVTWHPVPVPLSTGTGLLAVAVPEAQVTSQGHAVTLDRLLHSSPVGLAVADTELRFVYVNETYAHVHRIPVEQHLGRSVLEVLDLPDPEAVEKLLRRIVDRGETIENIRFAANRPDGDSYEVLGNLFPLQGADGRVMGVAAIVYELTDGGGELLDTAHGRRRLELLGRVSARLGQGLDPRTVATELAAACVPGFAEAVEVDLLESAAQPTADSFGARAAESGEQLAAPPGPLFHPLNLTSGTSRPRPEDELPQPRPTLRAAAQCVSSAQPVAFETAKKDGSALHGMAVPLLAVGRMIGAVTFLRQVDAFSSEDTLLAREIAARTATAIDNALLYRRERLAALALQRHLLPTQLPSEKWFQLAYRYRPAEDDSLAGGDWYDAVTLPGGRIGLGIGDVIGHGVGAAAAMGCYRSSVHALLAVGLPPGQLLTRLDGLFAGIDGELAATCTCVVYDGGVGRCRVALAGHPPPLLVMPDGSVAVLGCEPGPPVGMGLHDVYADEEYPVPPGSLIVLYTDGMIEDRKAVLDLDQGIALLSRAVRDPKAPLDEICDAMTAVRPASSADDAALLVARLGRL